MEITFKKFLTGILQEIYPEYCDPKIFVKPDKTIQIDDFCCKFTHTESLVIHLCLAKACSFLLSLLLSLLSSTGIYSSQF